MDNKGLRKSNKLIPLHNKNATDIVDIRAAFEFLKRYYPALGARMNDKEWVQALAMCHTLFKTNPEILAAPLNKSPTQ